MVGFYLYGVGVPLTLWLLWMGGTLWLAARFGGRRLVWVLSGLAATIVVALVADALIGCVADPTSVVPTAAETFLYEDDEISFACRPIGELTFLTLYITAPLALLGQALLTWWMLDQAG